jgi:hypothetical protein
MLKNYEGNRTLKKDGKNGEEKDYAWFAVCRYDFLAGWLLSDGENLLDNYQIIVDVC